MNAKIELCFHGHPIAIGDSQVNALAMVVLMLEVHYWANHLKRNPRARLTKRMKKSTNILNRHWITNKVEIHVSCRPTHIARNLLHNHTALYGHMVGHWRGGNERQHNVTAGPRGRMQTNTNLIADMDARRYKKDAPGQFPERPQEREACCTWADNARPGPTGFPGATDRRRSKGLAYRVRRHI